MNNLLKITAFYIALVRNIEDSGVLLSTLNSKQQTTSYVMEKFFANAKNLVKM